MHVAIIMDGNRRYAKKKGLLAWKGHDEGAKRVRDLIEWCPELGINELTLYTFSLENFKREEKEVKELFRIFREGLKRI